MKLNLLLVPISFAVAKTHDSSLRPVKGWSTRVRFLVFLFATISVPVRNVFIGWIAGVHLMPTNYAVCKSSP
jgi:hypothetical protein